MNFPLLAFGIGLAELIILGVMGGGLLCAVVVCFIAIGSKSKGQTQYHSPQNQSPEQRLSQLNDLFAKKLITEAEYQERRAAILKDL